MSAGGTGPVLRGVGVGAAGVVDAINGIIISATDTLKGWEGTPLKALLAEAIVNLTGFSMPVQIQNDADAHLEGEAWSGVAVGRPSALAVAVGTGVGAAVLLDGRVWPPSFSITRTSPC